MSEPQDGEVKVHCRCPTCGHGIMWASVCEEEPSVGAVGFHCRGCGAEWDVPDVEQLVKDYGKALEVAREYRKAVENAKS